MSLELKEAGCNIILFPEVFSFVLITLNSSFITRETLSEESGPGARQFMPTLHRQS